MKVFGVLKESGIWRTDWRIWLDVRKSEFFFAQDKEDAEYMALNMWSDLAKSDQKNSRIAVTEKEVTEEDIARIKEECDVDTYEEALELAAAECPFDEISVITWASEQEKAKEEEKEEND